MDGLSVKRIAGSLGAEVNNVNLRNIRTPDQVAVIKGLLTEHKVLFFPNQSFTEGEHVALGRLFGDLAGHPNLSNTDSFPEIFQLQASQGGVANEWHTDLTFQKSPAKMSILYMRVCPEIGGDTMWTNLEAAYDALSEPMKAMCESLTALHDADPHGSEGHNIMAVHPVVRVHPITGRKALYVSEHFTRRIVELTHEESKVLLDFLCRWVQRPVFTVRYRWTQNTVAFWDNATTSHYVLNDFDQDRLIQRVTVQGDLPQPARPLPQYKPSIYQRLGSFGSDEWERNYCADGRHDRQLAQYLREHGDYQMPKL